MGMIFYRRLMLVFMLCLVQYPSSAQQSRIYPLKWTTLGAMSAPLVHATLSDGKIWLFIVDTGTPISLIDRTLVRQMKLPVSMTSDNGVTFEYVTPPLNLGPGTLAFPAVPFDLMDMSLLRQAYPDVVGILGMNFLFNFTVRLDYAKQQMDLSVGSVMGTALQPKEAIRLPLTQVERHYCVEAAIDNHVAPFIIDTGAERIFLRSPDLIKALKPRAALSGIQSIMATESGTGTQAVDTKLLRFQSFRLPGFLWENPVVEQSPDSKKHLTNGLGNHFLERFHVVLDFPASTLYLTPDPAFKEDPLEWVGVGLILSVADNKVIVDRVYAPSPAKEAGLLEGDEVVSFAGRSMKGMSSKEVADFVQSQRKLDGIVTLEVIQAKHLPARIVRLKMKSLL